MNTTLTTLDIPSLHRNFIGIDRLLDRMAFNMNGASDGYPPYNVIKEDENTFVIEIAVAGIPREGIKINTHESTLTVEATIEKLASEKEKEARRDKTSKASIAWALWGGTQGRRWVEGTLRDIERKRKKKKK